MVPQFGHLLPTSQCLFCPFTGSLTLAWCWQEERGPHVKGVTHVLTTDRAFTLTDGAFPHVGLVLEAQLQGSPTCGCTLAPQGRPSSTLGTHSFLALPRAWGMQPVALSWETTSAFAW